MPSRLHEGFVDILRRHRSVALELARIADVPVLEPESRWVVVNGDFADPGGSPHEYRTDLALVAFTRPRARRGPLESLYFEAQLRVDASKGRGVVVYRAGLFARYDCPGWGILLSPRRNVARWARTELLARTPELRPRVLGPDDIAPVLSIRRARNDPAWAALSAAMHARDEHAPRAALVALRACVGLSSDLQKCYFRLILSGLRKKTMQQLRPQLPAEIEEPLSQYEREGYLFVEGRAEGRKEGRKEGRQEGLQEGRRKGRKEGLSKGMIKGQQRALLVVLESRGFKPTAKQRATIEACDDLARLQRWLAAAPKIRTVRELLALD